MKISVVLATYNEETNLAECLESVKSWCDEIIIVDGSSIDKTVKIAKSFGAKVTILNNPAIFHINKQKAIDQAKSEWILQLDADERVTPQLKEEIDKVIDQKEFDGFWIPRKNFFLGKFLMKGGIYPDYTLRLYRRGKGKLPQKDVHEQAIVDGKVGYLENPLIHMADMTFGRYWLRFNRYTDLLAMQLKEKEKIFSPVSFIENVIVQPIYWFLLTYFRNKGFMDSWQGFIFSFFSSLRFPISYLKFLKHLYAGNIR